MYGKEKAKKDSCLGVWLCFRRDLFSSSSQDALALSVDECPSLAHSASFLTAVLLAGLRITAAHAGI